MSSGFAPTVCALIKKAPIIILGVAYIFFYFVYIALKQSLLSKFWSYFEDIVKLNLINRSSVLKLIQKP